MERTLLLSSFALGWAGWLLAALIGGAETRAPKTKWLPKITLGFAIALPIVIFLASLPSAPPWSAGQGWGRGFLLGSVCALLAMWASARAAAQPRHPLASACALTSPFFLALVAVSGSVLWLKADLIDTLMGVAIGWLCEALIVSVGTRPTERENGRGGEGEARQPNYPITQLPNYPTILAAGAAFTATLCATVALGAYRGTVTFDSYAWCAAAIVLAAIVPLALVLAGIPAPMLTGLALKLPLAGWFARLTGSVVRTEDEKHMAAGTWKLLLGTLLLIVAGKLISVKAIDEPHLFHVVLLGLGAGLLLWWLAPDSQPADEPVHRRAIRAMVIIAAFMVAYKLLAGFGVGIALIAAWLGFGLLTLQDESRGESRELPSGAGLLSVLTMGSILILYRLFATRYTSELRGVELDDHYALFGLVLGASLPAMVAGFQQRGDSSDNWNLLRLAGSGLMLLAVPAVTTMIWGSKYALAMIFGLALSAVFGGQPARSGQTDGQVRNSSGLLNSLFALAVGLALTQWMRHALPLASMARSAKIQLLGWSIGIFIVVIVVAGYAGRISAGRKSVPDGGSGR